MPYQLNIQSDETRGNTINIRVQVFHRRRRRACRRAPMRLLLQLQHFEAHKLFPDVTSKKTSPFIDRYGPGIQDCGGLI
jgi:hypothetical protein